MTDYITPDRLHSALLTIDVQRDFILSGSPAQMPRALEVIPAIEELVIAYRKQTLPVIHVVRLYLPDGSNVDICRRGLIEEGTRIVVPGSAGAELMEELNISPDVPLDTKRLLKGQFQALGEKEWIMYKPRWGAFYATPLESHLRDLGITTLVVCGCNFPNCPRTTIYEASERDFRIVLITDATSGVYRQGTEEMKNIGVALMTAREWNQKNPTT